MTSVKQIQPHGGNLLPLMVEDKNKRKELLSKAKSYIKITPISKELSDIIMLGTGSFSHLKVL